MSTKKIVVVLGIMTTLASMGAHAGLEAQYRPLLKQLNVVMCTIQDHKASNKAKARAQHKMLTIQNQLAPIKMKLSSNPAAYRKFIAAEGRATTNCKVASVSASAYKPLLKEMRKNTCILMGGGSSMDKARAAADNDRIKKELRPIRRSLKLNNKKAYARFRKEESQAAMGIGC